MHLFGTRSIDSANEGGDRYKLTHAIYKQVHNHYTTFSIRMSKKTFGLDCINHPSAMKFLRN